MFNNITKGALALAATVAFAGPAFAASLDMPGGEANVVTVKYDVADLHTTEGAKRIAMRVQSAASEVCGGGESFWRPSHDNVLRCRENTIARAIRDLGSPLVADALGRSPQSLARSGR